MAYATYATADDYMTVDQNKDIVSDPGTGKLTVNPQSEAAAKYLNNIEDTFLFTGGTEVAPNWNTLGDHKNFMGMFEEQVR